MIALCNGSIHQDMINTIVGNPPYHYNYCEIVFNNCIFPTFCLIDTGALHGNYAATWIKAYGTTMSTAGTTVCSPATDTCVTVFDCVNIS